MKDILEVSNTDLDARIGILHTKHGKIEVPTFVPVVHPIKQEISIDVIKRLGFDLVITNAYITMKYYGKEINESIHNIINFDKSIMTDSGGYQVLEYGDLDVDYDEVARFESRIKSDIAVPLDKPTGLNIDRGRAEEYVRKTLEASEHTIKIADSDTIWVGPIQGGKYLDLIEYSSRRLDRLGYEMFALGSPTEVMEAYDFRLLAEMIITAKRSIPLNKPLHLFGAGNPLTIPLAIALGCDTFDSASYMLYAKDDRYMLSNGTININDISYLPCTCFVCSNYKASELVSLPKKERSIEIAKHNLCMIKREVDAVKEAIMEGRLWEYVIQKSRSHPKLFAANYILKDIGSLTPLHKKHAIFFMDSIDQYRPEARRFRKMVRKIKYSSDLLILIPEQDEHPLYATSIYSRLKSISKNSLIAYYSPYLGIVPEELSDLFPAAHHLTPSKEFNIGEFPTFKEAFLDFVRYNHFNNIIILAEHSLMRFINEYDIKCKMVKSYDELLDAIIQYNI